MTGLQRKHLKEELQKIIIESMDEDFTLQEAVLPEQIARTKEWLIVEASYEDILSIAYYGGEPIDEGYVEVIEGLYLEGFLPNPKAILVAEEVDPTHSIKLKIKELRATLKGHEQVKKSNLKKAKSIVDKMKIRSVALKRKIQTLGKLAAQYVKLAAVYAKKGMKGAADKAKNTAKAIWKQIKKAKDALVGFAKKHKKLTGAGAAAAVAGAGYLAYKKYKAKKEKK